MRVSASDVIIKVSVTMINQAMNKRAACETEHTHNPRTNLEMLGEVGVSILWIGW